MIYRILSSIGLIVGFFLLLVFSVGTLQFLMQLFALVLLSGMLLVFLMSLRSSQTPLITRYALLMGAENSMAERRYTRQVTWLWVVFFFILCVLKVDGLMDVNHTTGWVEGVFYSGSVVLFVGEFYVRQLFLPAHKGSSLRQFFYQLSQVSVKDVWQFDTQK
ncbi:COG4648 family protein [Thiomicrorhabdus arctica]|uniref:hypothetical protein n=1 Tax=Thiomicrorhabdus arctica TaxID=131540 RepID=UPI000377994F|nr:hypothetical protein [Thiomicrorhabdus arctica]